MIQILDRISGRKAGTITVLLSFVLFLSGCSTARNTAASRFYHAGVAKYNTWFNGKQAYDKAVLAQEKAKKDNMLEVPDMFAIGDDKVLSVGTSDFDIAIEKAQKSIKLHSITAKPKKKDQDRQSAKDKEWQNRNEYNPFLWNAWMLMADAQAHKGEFLEAAGTYSYIAKLYESQPEIAAQALSRMAWCYSRLDWFYEADELFTRSSGMKTARQTGLDMAALKASALISQERYEESIPYLEKAITRRHNSRANRMREHYLLGQLYKETGRYDDAQDCFGKLIRMNPGYDMEFHARIRQTETLASGANVRKAMGKLERMLKDGKNKDRKDQIYYAMGNILLLENDTVKALELFEEGNLAQEKSTPEKGILLLTMADIYWKQGNYGRAGECYSQAVGMIGSSHKDFETVRLRSEVLETLNNSLWNVHLQDSLQWLATLPDTQVINIIDKVIEEVKAKEAREEEEARRKEEGKAVRPQEGETGQSGGWYFYNSQAVERGQLEFRKQWGERQLEDDWRRSNKSVLATDAGSSNGGGSLSDTGSIHPDSIGSESDSLQDMVPAIDLHDRQYYLDQIPHSPEALDKSNRTITRNLMDAGLVYKDRLQEYELAEGCLWRIVSQYPDLSEADDAAYNLYLMYSLWNRTEMADSCIGLMKELFPESEYTLMVSDPDYIDNARFGRHREDSLYTVTYQAFLDGDAVTVRNGCEISQSRYPKGNNRDKFMFLSAALELEQGNIDGFMAQMKELVRKYPKAEISQYAGLIVQGVESGRILQSSNLVSLWDRTGSSMTNEPDSLRPEFSTDRYEPYLFVLAYPEGELNENQLLFELAGYNFSNFMMRNFDLTFVHDHGIGMLQVSEFLNFDEAFTYSRQLYSDPAMAGRLEGIKALTISRKNLETLLKHYSFNEWQQFYEETFLSIPQPEIDGGTLYEELEEPVQKKATETVEPEKTTQQ